MLNYGKITKGVSHVLKKRGHVYLDCYNTGLKVSVEGEEDLHQFLIGQLGHLRYEQLGVGLLDGDDTVLAWSGGQYFTRNQQHSVSWNHLDMLRLIAMHQPHKLFISHNHPGGTEEFSTEDLETTDKLRDICDKLDIEFLGHYLVVNNRVLKTV